MTTRVSKFSRQHVTNALLWGLAIMCCYFVALRYHLLYIFVLFQRTRISWRLIRTVTDILAQIVSLVSSILNNSND